MHACGLSFRDVNRAHPTGKVHALLLYRDDDGDGEVEVQDLTKRQRAMVGGSIEILGRKLRALDDVGSSAWAMAWGEQDARSA